MTRFPAQTGVTAANNIATVVLRSGWWLLGLSPSDGSWGGGGQLQVTSPPAGQEWADTGHKKCYISIYTFGRGFVLIMFWLFVLYFVLIVLYCTLHRLCCFLISLKKIPIVRSQTDSDDQLPDLLLLSCDPYSDRPFCINYRPALALDIIWFSFYYLNIAFIAILTEI